MESPSTNPASDPHFTGYSKFSPFRVGNLIWLNAGSHLVIGEIISLDCEGDPTKYEVKNLSNGATGCLEAKHLGQFMSMIIDPKGLGFQQYNNDRNEFTDGLTILRDITDAVDGGYDRDIITHIGYRVYDAASEDILYVPKLVRHFSGGEIKTGLEHIHELQNLYADVLGKPLETKAFIENTIAQQKLRANKVYPSNSKKK